MADRPPTLRQLLHEFTDDYALLDEPLEFTYTEWSHGRAELARCVVTGLTVRQFKGRTVQTLDYDDIGAEYDVAEWEAAADALCDPTVGAVLTASDPEPGHGVTVEDAHGRRWRRTDGGDRDGAANWEKADVDYFEPESWTRVCEAGPVTVVAVDD